MNEISNSSDYLLVYANCSFRQLYFRINFQLIHSYSLQIRKLFVYYPTIVYIYFHTKYVSPVSNYVVLEHYSDKDLRITGRCELQVKDELLYDA